MTNTAKRVGDPVDPAIKKVVLDFMWEDEPGFRELTKREHTMVREKANGFGDIMALPPEHRADAFWDWDHVRASNAAGYRAMYAELVRLGKVAKS